MPVTAYLPFAFMNYFSVLLLVLYGCTGFTMARRMREDETQVGLIRQKVRGSTFEVRC
ncbi:MAG: hypothetical protein MZV49_13680 [Rhodopseudomonas palustris]|nr:hypothetical protein [Rhodopseudomonas palustris]